MHAQKTKICRHERKTRWDSVCGCDDKEPSEQGQPDEPCLVTTTWPTSDLDLGFTRECTPSAGPMCAKKGMR